MSMRTTKIGFFISVVVLAGAAVAARPSGHDGPRLVWAQQPAEAAIYLPVAVRHAGRADRSPPSTPVPTNTDVPTPTDEPTPTPTIETPEPTMTLEPTSTATATPMPTPDLVCDQVLVNGDFEQGARHWELVVSGQRQQLSLSIQHRRNSPQAPFAGDYLAFLGGLDGAVMTLTSNAFQIVRPDTIEAATFRMHLSMATNERPNGRDNDTFVAQWSRGGREQAIQGTSFSEETLPGDYSWRGIDADITELVKSGSGNARIIFRTTADASNVTWWWFDEVEVNFCRIAAP